jgi:hypothetical protein
LDCPATSLNENNFNSDVAKRWVFLPTTHMLPPHIKRTKYKIKFYTLPHETMTQKREKSLTMQQRKKRERRRRKKEES